MFSNQRLLQLNAAFVVLISLTGCGKDEHKSDAKGSAGSHSEAEGAHPEDGPHNGHLIELGKEEYHAELVHDDATQKVTIYLLDGAAKKFVAVPEKELTINLVVGGKPQSYKLPAVAQSNDAPGQSSRFELANEELCKALDDEGTTGRLSITIAGKPYSGQVTHAGHEDHK